MIIRRAEAGGESMHTPPPLHIPPTTRCPSNATALHSAVRTHGPTAVGVDSVVDAVMLPSATPSSPAVIALHDQQRTNPSSPPVISTLVLLMVPVVHVYAGPLCAWMRCMGSLEPWDAAGRARFCSRLCSVCTLVVAMCVVSDPLWCGKTGCTHGSPYHSSPQAVVATTWRSLALVLGSQAASYSNVCASKCSCSTADVYSSKDALLGRVLEEQGVDGVLQITQYVLSTYVQLNRSTHSSTVNTAVMIILQQVVIWLDNKQNSL